ncbi:hypothetical protein AUP68_04185 [Ilyonectria robusta]
MLFGPVSPVRPMLIRLRRRCSDHRQASDGTGQGGRGIKREGLDRQRRTSQIDVCYVPRDMDCWSRGAETEFAIHRQGAKNVQQYLLIKGDLVSFHPETDGGAGYFHLPA